MKKNNRITFKLQWLKGVSMSAPNGKFLAECIGKSILILSKLIGVFLLVKAIAPNGLIH